MTKNCHKVVRKYLTRNVKFMNIIPGCNTKVGGQKVVNKNCLMLCKWPEEASVRVWPNMSLQRAWAGHQLGCLYFLYLNVSLVQWIRRNIHGISNKNCWQIFICLVELSSILHDSNAMLHFCTRSALLKSFFCSHQGVWPRAWAINTNVCDKGGLHNVNTIMFKHEGCNWWCGILFGSGLFVASPNIIFIILSSGNNMINRLLRWWINPF